MRQPVKDSSDQHVVIIGGGHAGAEAVAALRQKGWPGDITLVSGEPQLPYQRPPLSKGYLKGKVSADALAIKKAPFYEKTETALILGVNVTEIDRDNHSLTLDNGDTLSYDKLIYATGTRARLLPVPGADLPSVFYLRTLSDVERIRASLAPGKRLLVIGAGYIGLEVAASAIQLGFNVTALEAQDRVLARVTSPEMSDFFSELHQTAGLDLRTGCQITALRADGQGSYIASVTDQHQGEYELPFDCAIVGIGVLPNTELAQAAGLDCDNGVLVDEFTATSDPDIFAVGDCSNHPSALYDRRLRLESVPNAADQAKVAAGVISGEPKPYTALPWFWSDQYEVKLQSAGLNDGYDELVLMGEPAQRRFFILYFREQQLICVDAINMPMAFMKAKTLIAQPEQRLKSEVLPVFQALSEKARPAASTD